MKKLIALMLLASPALGFSGQEVVVDNKGTAGQILISDGVQIDSGHTNGSWANPADLPALKGAKGDTGNTGASGPKGDKGNEGVAGKNGKDGKDADMSHVDDELHKANQTKYLAEGILRLYDSKRFDISAFGNYDFRGRRGHEIGARITYKVGKSYEERRIERLEAIIDQLISVAHEPRSVNPAHIHKD